MPDTLTNQQIAEIELREYVVEGWGRFIKLRPDERDSLIATVKQLRDGRDAARSDLEERTTEREMWRGRYDEELKEHSETQSQLEQLRAENEKLRQRLQRESLTADAYAADADAGDSFRSRAVDLCTQKVADLSRTSTAAEQNVREIATLNELAVELEKLT